MKLTLNKKKLKSLSTTLNPIDIKETKKIAGGIPPVTAVGACAEITFNSQCCYSKVQN